MGQCTPPPTHPSPAPELLRKGPCFLPLRHREQTGTTKTVSQHIAESEAELEEAQGGGRFEDWNRPVGWYVAWSNRHRHCHDDIIDIMEHFLLALDSTSVDFRSTGPSAQGGRVWESIFSNFGQTCRRRYHP